MPTRALALFRYSPETANKYFTSYDGAGNRHYAIIDDKDGGAYAVAGKTYGELLVWIGERADDRSRSTRPYVDMGALGAAR